MGAGSHYREYIPVMRAGFHHPNTIVPLKLDFVAQKKGGMAVSAV